MNDNERLEEISKRIQSKSYLANAGADIQYLLELIGRLQKKVEVLSTHNLELTQEMENIKSDFGDAGR